MGSARASSNLVRVDFFLLGKDCGEEKKWSMGVSIPLPADCEPTALPSELIPHGWKGVPFRHARGDWSRGMILA